MVEMIFLYFFVWENIKQLEQDQRYIQMISFFETSINDISFHFWRNAIDCSIFSFRCFISIMSSFLAPFNSHIWEKLRFLKLYQKEITILIIRFFLLIKNWELTVSRCWMLKSFRKNIGWFERGYKKGRRSPYHECHSSARCTASARGLPLHTICYWSRKLPVWQHAMCCGGTKRNSDKYFSKR